MPVAGHRDGVTSARLCADHRSSRQLTAPGSTHGDRPEPGTRAAQTELCGSLLAHRHRLCRRTRPEIGAPASHEARLLVARYVTANRRLVQSGTRPVTGAHKTPPGEAWYSHVRRDWEWHRYWPLQHESGGVRMSLIQQHLSNTKHTPRADTCLVRVQSEYRPITIKARPKHTLSTAR